MTIEEMNAKYGKPTESMSSVSEAPVDTSDLESAWGISKSDSGGKSTIISRAVPAIKEGGSELLDSFKKRGSSIINRTSKTAEQLGQGDYTAPLKNALGTVGDVAGTVGDIAGTGIKALYKTVTPEETQKAISQGVHSILATPSGQKGLQALGSGMESYNMFKEEHPDIADALESIVNVAGLFGGKALEETTTPLIKKAAESTVETSAPIVKKAVDIGREKAIDFMSKNKSKSEIQKFDSIAETIQPRMTVKEMAGVVTKEVGRGLNKKDIIDHSVDPQMRKSVEAVKDIIVPGATAGSNKNRILKVIAERSENVVKPFLAANKVPFNFQNLRDSFELVTPKSYLKSNPEAFATYSRVREELLSDIENHLKNNTEGPLNSTDMNELWNARKSVDKRIEEELNANLGEAHYAGAKAAAQDFRNQLAAFIDKSLEFPGQMEQINSMEAFVKELRSLGMRISNEKEYMDAIRKQFGITNTTEDMARKAFFRDQMDQMSAMYHAVDNLSTNIKRDIGKTKLKQFMEEHPVKGAIIGAGASGLIGAGAYEAITK